MSLLSSLGKNLLTWGLQQARTEGQTVGLRAINDAMNQLNEAAVKHAPDCAPAVQQLSQQLVATLVAGVLTKK